MANSPEQKLERVLHHFIDPTYRRGSSDGIYMEKLLSHLSGNNSYLVDLPVCKEWIQKMVETWKNNTPEPSLAAFALHFMGLVVSDWKRFELLQITDVVGQVSDLLKHQNCDNSSVKLAYVRMLSGLLKHDSGCKWIVQMETWKDVLQFCYESQSLYVLRESQNFIVELLDRLGGKEPELPISIMSHILSPLFTKDSKSNGKIEGSQPQHLTLTLELACSILQASLTNLSPVMSGMIEQLNLEALVWMLLINVDGHNNEEQAGKVSKLLALVYFTSVHRERDDNKIPPAAVKAMEKKIYNLLALHISRRSVTNFMNTVVQCQLHWHKISEFVTVHEQSEIKHFNFDTQLMALQLMPMLGCFRTKFTDNDCVELYINKLFRLTSEETQRLAYSYRDILVTQENKHTIAHQAMLSVLLFAVFQLSVQALQLMQVAIQNFMPPNLALLMNTLKGSTIDQVGPILQKRLHDVNWDVRDSALEVLQVVTCIAEIKFPAFQEHVLENELCPLVLVLAMDDSESYVRASAIKCLCAMVRVQRFWTDCLASQHLPSKMMVILQGESEGIVRREAAALLKEIYEHHKFLKAEMGNVFMAMAFAAVSDLHWEVKVNALQFWEKVIEQQMSDQGMIDGVFPSVTFSKENRKIVLLTENEIKLRLNKVLGELARIKCLQVLLLALEDHDIQVVRKAADIVTTLKDVLTRHGLVPDTATPKLLPDLISNCVKPANTNFKGVYDSFGCEVNTCLITAHKVNQTKMTKVDTGEGKISTVRSRLPHDSDQVIEAIVNDTDMNLLADVCHDYLRVENSVSNVTTNFNLDTEVNVGAEEFLSAISNLDLGEMVTQKTRWLDYCTSDLGSLLDDILSSHADTESNAMDCY